MSICTFCVCVCAGSSKCWYHLITKFLTSETGRYRQATLAANMVSRFPKIDANSKGPRRFGVRSSSGSCWSCWNQGMMLDPKDPKDPKWFPTFCPWFWLFSSQSVRSQTAKIEVNTANWITTDGMKSLGYFFMFLSNTYQPMPGTQKERIRILLVLVSVSIGKYVWHLQHLHASLYMCSNAYTYDL